MARESLPPGFRFHPTDEELVGYYLKRKVLTKPFQFEAIAELDLYKFAPWDLPEKSCLRSRDLEWFFFCPRDKKYTNGGRTNRATEIGYWKTTGKDRPVLNNSRMVGMKKTLVFHLGRAPRGDRTDWVMHEYRLEDDKLAVAGVTQDAYVLCRIFQKSGPGPKNGEQYGAPFREEDWDEELVDGSSVLFPVANDIPVLPGQVIDQSIDISKKEPKSLLQQDPQPSGISGVEEHHSPKNSPSKYDDIQSLLLQLSDLDDDAFPSIENDNNEKIPDGSTVGHIANPDGYDIYNGLEDITSGAELEGINKFVLPNNPEGGSLMDQMFNGIDVGSYLELNDLSLPMEAGASEIEIFSNIENPMDVRSRLIPLSGEIMPTPARDNFCPAFEGSNSFMYQPVAYGVPEQINWEYQADIQALDVSSDTKEEKAGNECIRGEQHNESSNFRHISSDGSSFSKLQSFLGSIPASPASAAEYPFSVKEGASMQKVSSYGSCVRFTAAVSVTQVCTKDSLLDRPVDFSCTCYGCKASVEGTAGKSGQGASSSAFMFVFLLSVISALMWVLLLAIGAKLGRYAWKLLLP